VLVRTVASGICHSDLHVLEMDGRLLLDEMISEKTRLPDVNAAFDRMGKRKSARQVIVFD
jgi:Zn-dependent alcohol dehydrogenase